MSISSCRSGRLKFVDHLTFLEFDLHALRYLEHHMVAFNRRDPPNQPACRGYLIAFLERFNQLGMLLEFGSLRS